MNSGTRSIGLIEPHQQDHERRPNAGRRRRVRDEDRAPAAGCPGRPGRSRAALTSRGRISQSDDEQGQPRADEPEDHGGEQVGHRCVASIGPDRARSAYARSRWTTSRPRPSRPPWPPAPRYADARVMEIRTESMSARNGVVEALDREERAGVGVRALIGSSWGFFAVPDVGSAAARRAGEQAAAVARASTLRRRARTSASPRGAGRRAAGRASAARTRGRSASPRRATCSRA